MNKFSLFYNLIFQVVKGINNTTDEPLLFSNNSVFQQRLFHDEKMLLQSPFWVFTNESGNNTIQQTTMGHQGIINMI
jgi:hypothetical protein